MEMFFFTGEEKYKAHQDHVPETARLLMPAHGEATLETATPIPRRSSRQLVDMDSEKGQRLRKTAWNDALGQIWRRRTCLTSTMTLRCYKDTVVEKRCDNRSSIHEDARQLCIQSQEFP